MEITQGIVGSSIATLVTAFAIVTSCGASSRLVDGRKGILVRHLSEKYEGGARFESLHLNNTQPLESVQ
jgi:hypothetical protein